MDEGRMTPIHFVRYRRVDSGEHGGQWCTQAYAKRNPDTTYASPVDTGIHDSHEAGKQRMACVLQGIAQAEPEDVAEWVLEGFELLIELGDNAKAEKVAKAIESCGAKG